MRDQLLVRVEDFIRRHEMCGPEDRVLVACSGGPDSSTLLDILRILGPRLRIAVGAVHVDHGQHKESSRVLDRVSARCRRWKLPFFAGKLDVPPGSSEERLRSERYRAFRQTAERFGFQHVATGHTQSDQVETVLMRILRGTGVAGLSGIPAVRDVFIRPLLECSREEILTYLKSRRLSWHEDPTNKSKTLFRNRIRHEILPLLRRQANPSVDRALLRLSDAAARDSDFIERMAQGVRPDRSADGVATIPLALFDELHDSLVIRVVLDMLRSISPPGANLEKLHVDRILSMIRRPQNRGNWSLDLPGGVVAGRKDRSFYLRLSTRRSG